jgi:segregation and condensation protein B
LETLAIIAFKQPVTKAVIENIRGVNSDHGVNRLVEYGLVEEKGRLDAPGRPILFGTSEEFLMFYGLKSVDELLTAQV